MSKKKVLLTFMVTSATAFAILGSYSISKNNFFSDLKASGSTYKVNLSQFDGWEADDEYSGVFSNENIEMFYLSHADAEVGEDGFSLKAKDEKTPAVLVNKTVINGLTSVKVKFSGGPLYAIATSSFFERYEYVAGDQLTNEVEKQFVGTGLGYLLILSPSTTGADIEDVTIEYKCAHEVDEHFFYAPSINRHTGARSLSTNNLLLHDYVQFNTAPDPYSNNFSKGNTEPHENPDSWYRWNGINLRNHRLVGGEPVYDGVPFGNFASNKFEIITSVMAEPSIFYKAESWYSASPWVSLDTADHGELIKYMQAHIGNDNYDPTGGLVHTDYTDTYVGRFYTKYGAGGGGYSYGFFDPDVATVVDSTMTLREAYEATNLPFFHVRFVVIENSYSVYINGFEVQHEDNFFFKEYDGQKYSINDINLHGVNYGLHDGSAGDGSSVYEPYRLTYLNPIVREIA